jgi:hypothetical protein
MVQHAVAAMYKAVMRTNRLRAALHCSIASMAVTLAGCAAVVYDGKFNWHDGWREAKVLQVGSASEIPAGQSSDCRNWMTPAERSETRFALLSYSNFARLRHRVVPIGNETLATGDVVYMKPTRCDLPIERANPKKAG